MCIFSLFLINSRHNVIQPLLLFSECPPLLKVLALIIHISSFYNGLKNPCSTKLIPFLRTTWFRVVMYEMQNCYVFFFFLLFFSKCTFLIAKFYLTKYQISNQFNFFSGRFASVSFMFLLQHFYS